jgi:hypothetical protein
MIGKYDIYVQYMQEVNSMYRIGCLYKRGSCQQCFGSIVSESVSHFSVNPNTVQKSPGWKKSQNEQNFHICIIAFFLRPLWQIPRRLQSSR